MSTKSDVINSWPNAKAKLLTSKSEVPRLSLNCHAD